MYYQHPTQLCFHKIAQQTVLLPTMPFWFSFSSMFAVLQLNLIMCSSCLTCFKIFLKYSISFVFIYAVNISYLTLMANWFDNLLLLVVAYCVYCCFVTIMLNVLYSSKRLLTLCCDVPVDFEYQLTYIQPHPSFHVAPSQGTVQLT